MQVVDYYDLAQIYLIEFIFFYLEICLTYDHVQVFDLMSTYLYTVLSWEPLLYKVLLRVYFWYDEVGIYFLGGGEHY